MIAILTARPGRAALLSLMLMTSACASVPNLGAKPEPRALSDFASTASFIAERGQWPSYRWWKGYADSQLDALMAEAVAGSPDLEAAAARLRSAEGYAQKAGAALKPQIDGYGQVQEGKLSQTSTPGMPAALVPNGFNGSGEVGLSFSLDLDLWGKNRAALRAARKDADSARYELQEAALTLTTSIASSYADLAALYAQLDSNEAALNIRAQSAKLVRQRVEIGLDNRSSLEQANARVAQAKSEIEATTEAIELNKHAIAALIGAGPDRALQIERPNVSMLHAQGLPEDASINLIGRRPDIASSRTRVEAAAERIKESHAAFYPSVNLSALVGLSTFGLGNLAGSSSFASVGPAVSLPLFHGGALQGQYRGRRGEYDEAVALYDGQVIQALRETADAVTSQKILEKRLDSSRGALANFREAHRLAKLRYGQGLATYLDVLSAEEGVVSAQLSVAQLESRAFSLDVQLIRALGGGFTAA